MKTLIVEDDYASRIILQRLLMRYGETQVAGDGEEAMAKFTSAKDAGDPFDLVCLDIMLPKLDGLSVLRAIRALESAVTPNAKKPIRIIMTTAVNDKANVVAAIKNCDGFIVKPYDMDKLILCLKGLGFEPA